MVEGLQDLEGWMDAWMEKGKHALFFSFQILNSTHSRVRAISCIKGCPGYVRAKSFKATGEEEKFRV